MNPAPQSRWTRFVRFYPWMLLQKWAIGMLLVVVGFVFFQLAGLRLLIRGEYTGVSIEALVFISNGVFFALMAWWQFRFLSPMGPVLEKTKALAKGEDIGDVWEDNPYQEDEDDEWSDLEVYVNQIRAKVVEGQETLHRERQGIQTLVHSSGDAILAVDREGFSVFFNNRLEDLVGRDKLFQKHVRVGELFREPDILDSFNRVLSSGTGERLSLQLVPSGEALPRYYSMNVVPLIKQANGDVYGAMGIFHDVTELKRAELIKMDFVANVSHELRTPLTSVKGYVQAIEADLKAGDTQQIGKQLKVVSSNIERLITLVHDLLDLSALEAGADLQFGEADVDDVTEGVLAQLEDQRKAKNIRIETHYEVGTIRIDRKRVEQVLLNLIQNAIRYIGEGQSIWVRWEDGEDGSVTLRVRDNGPGIAAEHLPRIFERFYRVDAARSRQLGGTGLGLAIVKHIMQRHGGSVSVKSEVGKGTEFVCKFPPTV
ncbi:MAG TPA: ATP-binding protein [Bdellovibrionales bacterium]|nr:ATP-binding protein [Bdellovibrionales bacterium]